MSINDPVFGTMEYDFQWIKHETIIFCGREYSVSVVAQSRNDTEKEISQIQQEAYSFFKTHLELLESSIIDCLEKYCKEILEIDNCPSSDLILDYNTPTTIFFAVDGSWGILFESDFDSEDGIAIKYINGNWDIGKQDILI